MSLARVLPICLLVLQAVTAYDLLRELESDEAPKSKDLSLRFYETLKPRADAGKSIESVVLLSRNYMSRMTFRQSADQIVSATIERFTNGQPKKCSLQPFDDQSATYNVRLWSPRGKIEILEAIRMYDSSKDNALDLFVVNMTDCQLDKVTILKGYDFSKYKGPHVTLASRHDGDHFDVFSLNGKDECGSHVCQRTYFTENRTMSEPRRFELLNEMPGWRLTFIAASSDRGYFALVRQKTTIRLMSLTPEGGLINSSEEKLDSKLRFLKISTANDAFGACYVEDKKPKEAQCVQLDRKLKVNLNRTLALEDEVRSMALYNLAQGGFALLTVRCAEDKKERCDNFDIKVTEYKIDGSHDELAAFKEESCTTRKRQAFHFYDNVDGKLCLFYSCECQQGESAGCDKMFRNKCIDKGL